MTIQRKNILLSDFDLEVILSTLRKQLQNERTNWGWCQDLNMYYYRDLTTKGKQIKSTIEYIEQQIK